MFTYYMIAVNSLILVVSSIKNHQNCHTNTLSHPPPVTTSSIEIHSHLMSNKNKSYKTNHIHTKFRYFMNDIYKQSSDSHNPMSNSSKVLKTLLQSLKNKRNRAKLLTNMHNKTRLRIRRNLLRESNMNNENLYDADDRNYLRNRQEDINEQRRGFDEEYYLPIETNLKMRDSNDLYDDEIDRMNNIHVDNEQRQADKKIMQNNEKLIIPNRGSNDYNHRYRTYYKNNHNRKKFRDKVFNTQNYMLNRQRDINEKKYLDNDYLENED